MHWGLVQLNELLSVILPKASLIRYRNLVEPDCCLARPYVGDSAAETVRKCECLSVLCV